MAKGEKFKGQKEKSCECCGGRFVPAWNHPEQKYCRNADCIRKRNAQRKRKSTSRLMRNAAYRRATSRRKHAEYERRKACLAAEPAATKADMSRETGISDLELTMLGLLSMVTDIQDRNDLRNLHSRCYEIGRNCFPDHRGGVFRVKRE